MPCKEVKLFFFARGAPEREWPTATQQKSKLYGTWQEIEKITSFISRTMLSTQPGKHTEEDQ